MARKSGKPARRDQPEITNQQIMDLFNGLLTDFDDLEWLIQNRPLLAHYTSISCLEKILKDDEIWLSNPLFMNDLDEIRFGVIQGLRLFRESKIIEDACASAPRTDTVRNAFEHYYHQFELEHVFDIYVFCLTEHDPADNDGLLSMWRAYGGQGDGAALIFNTKLITEANPQSPLLVSKVRYAPSESRINWLENKLHEWCSLVKMNAIPDDKLHIAAYQIFTVIKLYALSSKHNGFREEEEWRVIYVPERDPTGILKGGYHHIIGSRGVEPKLKLPIRPIPPFSPKTASWTFNDILDRIILGPSVSSPLAQCSRHRRRSDPKAQVLAPAGSRNRDHGTCYPAEV